MVESSPGLLRLSSAFQGRLRILAERRPGDGPGAAGPRGDPALSQADAPEEATYEVEPLPKATATEDPDETFNWLQEASRLDTASRLDMAERVAAVSGRLDPNDLFEPGEPEALKRRVLSLLAPACEIEGGVGGLRWLLLDERRSAVLRNLVSSGRLAAALAQTLPATDDFGRALRDVLRHGSSMRLWHPGEAATEDEERRLLAVSAAVEAARRAGLPAPDAEAVNLAVGQASFLSEHRLLTRLGVVGRGAEEAELAAFLVAPPASGSARWDGFILTGLGGAGKSTLLAKFIVDVARSGRATVAVLDFDRPGVDAGDPPFMEREITRQVGYQRTSVARALQDRRRELRTSQGARPEIADRQSDERASRSIIAEMAQGLLSTGHHHPFLLVLDTFEEVTRQGTLGRLLSWLDELAEFLAPLSLKVVVAGRLMREIGRDDGEDAARNEGTPDPDLDKLRRACSHMVLLGELRPAAAERLLRKVEVPHAAARRLARSKVLPRRPLELKLLGRLLREDPETDVAALEEEVRSGSGRGEALFAGIVYRRVLLRLRDPVARALANPGLVLRYVTPDLIREVLVPALGLKPLSPDEAEGALRSLAAHDWLAYRAPDGSVWHRRDLRRSMLPAMLAAAPDEARRIHGAAAEYLDASSDDRDRAEAFYHRLMLLRFDGERQAAWADDIAPAVIRKASDAFHLDLDDLPLRASALVRFARSPASVSPAEIPLLPVRHRERAVRAVGERLVRSRAYRSALGLLAGRNRPEGFHADGRVLPPWEASTLFATASWSMLLGAEGQEVTSGSEWRPVREIVARCHPFDLAHVAGASDDWVEDRLRQLEFGRPPPPQEALRLLRDLATVLVARFPPGTLGQQARRGVQILLQETLSWKRRPPFEPTVLLLARLVDFPGAELPVRYGPADLRLETQWLASASRALGRRDPAGLARQAIEVRHRCMVSTRPTVIRMLAEVDALAKRRDNLAALRLDSERPEVNGHDALYRGPSPEFRNPARYALAEAFPDRDALRQLAGVIAGCLEGEWVDLRPDVFADRLADDPLAGLQPYVEAVDRSWNLGRLLDHADDLGPDGRKVGIVRRAFRVVLPGAGPAGERLPDVRRAFGRWDRRVEALIR